MDDLARWPISTDPQLASLTDRSLPRLHPASGFYSLSEIPICKPSQAPHYIFAGLPRLARRRIRDILRLGITPDTGRRPGREQGGVKVLNGRCEQWLS